MAENLIPVVSVIIPTYNHARYLDSALQSLFDQTYRNWEVIVVDNYSTDHTDEVMASFSDPRVNYLKIKNNGVIAASRNAGIRTAKGEWIAFLDSDDWWTPDKLQVCLDKAINGIDVIYHDMKIVGEHRNFFQRKKIKSWQLTSPVLLHLLLDGNAIVNSSVLVRRNLLIKIGGLSEAPEMVAAEDYNAWLRIAQLTENFLYIPKTLGHYLWHSQGVSRKNMSIPARHACAEFLTSLNEQQKFRLEANFRFTEALFAYDSKSYGLARENLLFTFRYGNALVKLKSVVLWAKLFKKLD